MAAMVPILTILLCFSQTVLLTHGIKPNFQKLPLPSIGTESYAFDPDTHVLYTALNDGRIVKSDPVKNTFVDFATTTANRSKALCDGTDGSNVTLRSTCGRPLALAFNHKTKELYIVDAYSGLFVVGLSGGVATPLTPNGHFDFADGIDIDPVTGIVYFTDLGDVLDRYNNNLTEILQSQDRGGSLLQYDPTTKRGYAILVGLAVPAGVAVSRDGSYVLITEFLTGNIIKYSTKTNTVLPIVQLPGNPDNIKRTSSGDFWVAVNIHRLYPELTVFPVGQKISLEGKILETVNFYDEYNATYVAEVQEFGGDFYVASLIKDYVGVYKRLLC